jgi:integrase
MSVRLRQVEGKQDVWEVDIRVLLPDGTKHRERREAPVTGKSNAQRWAKDRERFLLRNGKPRSAAPRKEAPTVKEFAPRFLAGYASANQQKPSGVAAKETILRVHLAPFFGETTLDAITTEDVQRLKAALMSKAPKTVNNVLTVLATLLRTAVEWGVIEGLPCSIKLLKTCRPAMTFHDFEAFEQLVEVAESDCQQALLIVLLGGEAGLRCGEIMALEWKDVDLNKRQLCVARSEWKGHVTAPKGGRIRHIPMTTRLAQTLRDFRHLRNARVVCNRKGESLTQKEVQVIVRRVSRKARLKPGVHILRHTFCSHLAMRGAPARAIQELAGHQDLATTQRYMHLTPAALDTAIRLLDNRSRGAEREAAGTGS